MNFRRFALALNGAALENADVLRRRRSLRESALQSLCGPRYCRCHEDGSRTVSIRRFGTLEVRLVEFATRQQADSLEIWFELYDYDTQSSLDSCLCHDLDEAEPMLEHLFSSARHLTEPHIVPK
jgi:hypothetical protein